MIHAALLIIQVCAAVLLGFFLPGYFLADWLAGRDRILWSFPLSLLQLYIVIFAAGMIGLPITAPVISSILLLIILGYAVRKFTAGQTPPIPSANPRAIERSTTPRWFRRWMICGICVLTAIVILRTTLWPLSGWDTPFRWDFLAVRMLEQHGFAFYPPVSAADFHIYFYNEPTPPLVEFSYWWLYAAAGGHYPALTSILVGAQLVWTIWFTYRIGCSLDSARAGWMAAGTLAGSALFVRSVAIGQENGLMPLSMAAMIFAAVDTGAQANWRMMILAGLAAAVGALAREWGCLFPVLGAGIVIWLGGNWKRASIICIVAALAGSPWYVRNILHTGNPFFPNRFGPFPVDKVHSGMFDFYAAHIGIMSWSAGVWGKAMISILHQAPMQYTIGTLAGIVFLRRLGFLFIIGVIVTALWLYALRYSVGGWEYEARVLSPAIAVLSITAAIWMSRWRNRKLAAGSMAIICALLLWSIVVSGLLPFYPTANTLGHWTELAALSHEPPKEWWMALPSILPSHSRVISINPYIHADLAETDVDIVPPWSPEVEFIADGNINPAVARQRLIEMGIRYVIYQPILSGQFLTERIPLFRDDMRFWKVIAKYEDGSCVYELPEVGASTTSQP